jgi:hypothetical protein
VRRGQAIWPAAITIAAVAGLAVATAIAELDGAPTSPSPSSGLLETRRDEAALRTDRIPERAGGATAAVRAV